MKTTYTKKEVENILLSVFLFAGANNDQGVAKIDGQTYGNKIETILTSWGAVEPDGFLDCLKAFKQK